MQRRWDWPLIARSWMSVYLPVSGPVAASCLSTWHTPVASRWLAHIGHLEGGLTKSWKSNGVLECGGMEQEVGAVACTCRAWELRESPIHFPMPAVWTVPSICLPPSRLR